MSQRSRIAIVLFGTTFCMSIILGVFWAQDWRYALPTPRPRHLSQPSPGSRIPLSAAVFGDLPLQDGKPFFLHFFSQDCPCSRFNLDHVRTLCRRFGTQVRFLLVLHAKRSPATLQIARDLHLDMETVADADGSLARRLGVYSTPQAVLLDRQGRLYYRGNYNLGRYCTEPQTEFARLALEALLAGRTCPVFPKQATIAYGCALPANRTKQGVSIAQ